MGIREDANECARRWIACNDRRVKKGKDRWSVTSYDMFEFAGGIADWADCDDLARIVDLALEKVLEYDRRVAARTA